MQIMSAFLNTTLLYTLGFIAMLEIALRAETRGMRGRSGA